MTEFQKWKANGRIGRIKLKEIPGYSKAAEFYYLLDGRLYGWKDKEILGSWSKSPKYPYKQVTLKQEAGGITHARKCRIIATAYVDGHKPGFEVDHIDGDKTNDAPSNLEWVSHAENMGRIRANEKQLTFSTREGQEVIRCSECLHARLCDQCVEINGKMYHVVYCSYGERILQAQPWRASQERREK